MIKASGSYVQVIDQVSKQANMDQELVAAAISFIVNNPEILSDEERISTERLDIKNEHGASNLLIGDGNYYILIKESVLIFVCLLLSEHFKDLLGMAPILITPMAIGIMKEFRGGTFSIPFGKIEEENGVKCILKELMRIHNKRATSEIVKKMIGKRCDKDYKCKYRNKERCTCTELNIRDILSYLENKRLIIGDNIVGYTANC